MKQAPIRVGEEHEVVIESVGSRGDGVARIKKFVVFVPEAVEGKTYRIGITKVLERVGFAEIIEEIRK